MVSLVAALLLSLPSAQIQTVELTPTDDIWVYPHASDPSKDEYLRIWGVDGKSVATTADNVDEFSYSFLKWSLKDLPKDRKLVEAKLVITQVANPAYSVGDARQAPIQVRPVAAGFNEKGWQHSQIASFSPGGTAKDIFAANSPEKVEKNDKPIAITFDLLKGPNDFKAYLAEAAKNGDLALALTSAIDASQRAVYKVYSKDGPKEHRPLLILKFE